MICFLLFLHAVVCPSKSQAQQPAYFLLGEEQFNGTQIYDVIQDNALNYWFATNEGLYYYDYYHYQRIEPGKAKSNSVFKFVMDDAGIIYCHNLNNQVFRIQGKTCTLFYELKEDEGSADISLAIAGSDTLIICAKKIIVLDRSGHALSRYNMDNRYIGPAYTTKTKEVLVCQSNSDSLLVYSKGTFSKHKLHVSPVPLQQSILRFFSIKGQYYAIDLRSKETYSFNLSTYALIRLPKNKLFDRSESVRLYETKDGLWVANSIPGTMFFPDSISANNNNIYYEDYFISNVYQDKEGNILLSTFDKGVLVITNLNVPDVINTFREDPITALYADATYGLLLGSSKGKLMRYSDKKLSILNSNGKRPIIGIHSARYTDLALFDDGQIQAYNKNNGSITEVEQFSLKDAAIVSTQEFYLGTNNGVIETTREGKNKFTTHTIEELKNRIYFLAYNTVSRCLYASTSEGLFVKCGEQEKRKITYRNEDIFPNGLHYSNGKVYACTKKDGILVIEGDKVTATILPIINGETEELKKIIIHNNTIVGNSASGMFQFSMNGKLLQSIHTIFRFTGKKVMDFSFSGEDLWVSHSGGVQKIDLELGKSNVDIPTVRIEKIFINDKEVDYRKDPNFNSDQRKIQFIVSSPTLRNRENIQYEYRLTGYETNWNVNNYQSNRITYNALSPGSYSLEVRAVNQGRYSKLSGYPFTIAQPFYMRWYFILACIILFIFMVMLVYRWQLNIQRKKSQQINELNASKLTAIQSQMNPHFIFNSLNSIQDLILKGDVEHSYSYITTFSNLVRRTLNYSDKDFIDFEQEIKLLELYLSLEKLRFKKDFVYTIETNGIIDIQIPPMLIQPFIENALAHGLLHKEGEKKLSITFELQDVLICVIEDNGVGREKSQEIAQRSGHESFSGKAIHNRFEILSSALGGRFNYTYEDLSENGAATGTRVTLAIPVKREF